jgi:hypothetical protein
MGNLLINGSESDAKLYKVVIRDNDEVKDMFITDKEKIQIAYETNNRSKVNIGNETYNSRDVTIKNMTEEDFVRLNQNSFTYTDESIFAYHLDNNEVVYKKTKYRQTDKQVSIVETEYGYYTRVNNKRFWNHVNKDNTYIPDKQYTIDRAKKMARQSNIANNLLDMYS